MANKNFEIIVAFLTLSCLLSLAYGADNDVEITVQGNIYCDPCRVQFKTRLSKPIVGAKVKLECRTRDNETVIYTEEAVTNERGNYKLPVNEDFEEQICEVSAVSSPRDDCSDKFDEIEKARVLITKRNGIKSDVRYANPIGFMKKEIRPECKSVIEELFPEDMPEEFKKKFEEK